MPADQHIIRKEDLLEMLKRFGDKLYITVEVGRDKFYIERVVGDYGGIAIKCVPSQ